MYKLSATDAGFLYAETPLCPMHVASVQVMALPEGVSEDEFIATLRPCIAARSHMVPYLTNRLQATPFDLDHPVWVRDPDFDISRHIYRVDVPAPGGQTELEQTIAELHAAPLDRSRPLWEMAVLCGLANEEGLGNRRVAYYSRVHHACLDGLAGQAATMMLMDSEPESQNISAPPSVFSERPTRHSAPSLLADAWRNFTAMQIDQVTRWPERLTAAARLWQRALDPSKSIGTPQAPVPKTVFNQPLSTARTYAVGELPVADIKAVGRELGATLNDVFLAVCGGGLRRYLEAKGELPRAPLIAGCPVSLRQPGDAVLKRVRTSPPRQGRSSDASKAAHSDEPRVSLNNQVTMMQVALGTDIADAKARVAAVAASARAAKAATAQAAPLLTGEASLPGLPAALRSMALWTERTGLADGPQPINVVISNVPGPRQALYSNGARMLTHYPVSIPAHGTGVNLTVQSYDSILYLGITACANALPDAGRLRDELLAEFIGLKAAVLPAKPTNVQPLSATAPLSAESLPRVA